MVVNRVWRWLDSPAARRFMQLLAVISLVLSLFVLARQNSLTNCLSRYNDRAAKATAARTAAAEQDREAQDKMWQAFADAGDPNKVPPDKARDYAATAFKEFLLSRAEANLRRSQNPLPAPPSEVCH